MNPEISEFAYGFALVDELIHWHGWPLTAVPIYPSLRQEAHLGYDVLLQRGGIPVFFQFKLSHCMVRHSAYEVADGYFLPPVYRMYLRPRRYSQQHKLLVDLDLAGNEVYYAAPVFHLPHELNTAYLNHEVCQRSRFFRPAMIGPLPDDDSHFLAFQQAGAVVMYSEPKKMENALDGKGLGEALLVLFKRKGKTALTEQALRDLRNKIVELLHSDFDEAAEQFSPAAKTDIETEKSTIANLSERLTPLGQIAYLARTYFGCELIVVTEKQNER